MADEPRPIIIKRKKIVQGGGHHGGAWKVAYADFVTAMMAFFMLMWLLNATTEKQRKGLADYFAPTIPVIRVSGGGDGAFRGDSTFAQETLARNGQGALVNSLIVEEGSTAAPSTAEARAQEDAAFEELIAGLVGAGGDSALEELALKHIQTRLTDEGLVIELVALEGRPLFEAGAPTPLLGALVGVVSEVIALVENRIALGAHVRSPPIVAAENRVWEASMGRAQALRRLLLDTLVAESRFERVVGHGDRAPQQHDALDIRNNRLEIILLRSDK